jgi:FixJ family two-component response regulator
MSGAIPRIVVVEDDASMSRSIERILRAGGFAAATFVTAEAALDAEAAAAADCLVLDIHLPGISGVEFYQRLSRSGAEAPAIFITADDAPAVREMAEGAGASAYLPKPFSGRALLEAVNRALGFQ